MLRHVPYFAAALTTTLVGIAASVVWTAPPQPNNPGLANGGASTLVAPSVGFYNGFGGGQPDFGFYAGFTTPR